MRTTLCACLAAVAVTALGQRSLAEEPKRPEAARAEAFFRHLDKNHNGTLEPEELPPRMKEAPGLLEKIDKNRDKKIDMPEFLQAARHFAEHQATRCQQTCGRLSCGTGRGGSDGRSRPGGPPRRGIDASKVWLMVG